MAFSIGDRIQIHSVREHAGDWYATSQDFTTLWFPLSSTNWKPAGDGNSKKDEDLSTLSYLPSGEGIMVGQDGSRYSGKFQDGKFSGRGVYSWPQTVENTPKYSGEFLDNRLHGHGVLTWSNGETFAGSFKRNCPEKGVLQKPGQSTKVGPFPCSVLCMNCRESCTHSYLFLCANMYRSSHSL